MAPKLTAHGCVGLLIWDCVSAGYYDRDHVVEAPDLMTAGIQRGTRKSISPNLPFKGMHPET